jgi:hypothetical protein
MENIMMNSKNDTTYFNATMNAVGYVNSISFKKSTSKNKRDVVTVSVAVLYGNSKKPKKEFYVLTVDALQAIEMLVPISDSINDPDRAVFASMVISKRDSSTYIKPGLKDQPLGVMHYGSLREVNFLKVDKELLIPEDWNSES